MKPEVSLPSFQQPTTCFYPEFYQLSQRPSILFIED
jgi:hypothetical protein